MNICKVGHKTRPVCSFKKNQGSFTECTFGGPCRDKEGEADMTNRIQEDINRAKGV